MRIVSLCPSNTELLAYLQATDLLVGIDNYSDWPENILSLPRLGPDLSIDMEKVIALEPDLVLASLSVPGMERNINALQKTGLNYVTFNPSSFDDIFQDLLTLGELINKSELAKQIVDQLRNDLKSYKGRANQRGMSPTLYWEWWPKPIFTPGATNWLTEMSHLVGATNCFEDQPVANVQTDWENVRQRDPDHICLVWVGVDVKKVNKEVVLKRPGIKEMTAYKNDNIHILPEPFFCRPSPRLFEGVRLLENLLIN